MRARVETETDYRVTKNGRFYITSARPYCRIFACAACGRLGPRQRITNRSYPVLCKYLDELPVMIGKLKCLGCWNKERAANRRVSEYYETKGAIARMQKELSHERQNQDNRPA